MRKTDQDAVEEYAARLEDAHLQAQHLLFATSVPLRHWDTLNNHRTASSLMRFVEGEERWDASDHFRMFSLKIRVEPSQIVLSPT
ncbi:hypothetical protein TNCV_1121991 [Trichonephila clavipes]|nr:hypothetical protein TNCV_1121991 [Trichonephila clavipes]